MNPVVSPFLLLRQIPWMWLQRQNWGRGDSLWSSGAEPTQCPQPDVPNVGTAQSTSEMLGFVLTVPSGNKQGSFIPAFIASLLLRNTCCQECLAQSGSLNTLLPAQPGMDLVTGCRRPSCTDSHLTPRLPVGQISLPTPPASRHLNFKKELHLEIPKTILSLGFYF